MNKFNVEIEVHAKSVETAVELNFVQTEVDVTEILIPRPLIRTLSKSWFSQKIAKALKDLIVPEGPQGITWGF